MTVGGVQIEPKVTWGQIFQVGALLVAIVMAWGNADSRISANEREVAIVDKGRVEDKATSLERDARQDASLSELTRSYNTLNLTLEGIRVDVGYLRRQVEDTKRAAAGLD